MDEPAFAARVEAVRHFSRYYTRAMGLLNEGLPGGAFTLTEARVIWELTRSGNLTARDLVSALGLDPGYLSRVVGGLGRRGVLTRVADPGDRRRRVLTLTRAGFDAFAQLNDGARAKVGGLLARLAPADQDRLVAALGDAERLLGGQAPAAPPILLRGHRPGDLGWVVSRHGALYAAEFGWDATFEALVAEIAATFLRDFDPARDRAFIAECAGVRVGCAFVVHHAPDVAKLRMVLVEPALRGQGLGRRLTDEAIAFARTAGYRRMTLWTNDPLVAARRVYLDAGFRLTATEPVEAFGHRMASETWARDL